MPTNLAKIINKKWIFPSILALILFGGILRFYNLSNQSYWMDEGYTVNAVLSISEHGSTILDSGEKYSCPTYCYPTAYLVKLFGDDPSSYRLLSVIAGLLFILVIFFITKRLFNKNIALLSSFFVTFSYWQIAWSRQTRWYTLFALLFWLALYFFYKSLYSEKNKYLNISLTAIFTVIAVLTHGLGYLLPLIFIGWFFIDQIFIQKKFNWKKSLIVVLGGAIALWLLNSILNIDIIGYLFNTSQLHYTLPYYLSFYLRNYWFFIALALIALFGLSADEEGKNNPYKKESYFLLFTLATYFVALSFFTNIVHYRYLFHLTPIFFILGSLGVLNLERDIKPIYGKVVLWIIVLGLFFTIAGGVFLPQTNYYLESDDPTTLNNRPHYAYTPQPNWNSAYAVIKENKTAEEIIISSHPHFNKIFLNEAGYWIKYNYLGFNDNKSKYNQNDTEYYVGATIIDDLAEFKKIINNKHGFIVFDYMFTQRDLPEGILDYIRTKLDLTFHEQTNSYSEIWVYRF